jgi:hypothetical protein
LFIFASTMLKVLLSTAHRWQSCVAMMEAVRPSWYSRAISPKESPSASVPTSLSTASSFFCLTTTSHVPDSMM